LKSFSIHTASLRIRQLIASIQIHQYFLNMKKETVALLLPTIAGVLFAMLLTLFYMD